MNLLIQNGLYRPITRNPTSKIYREIASLLHSFQTNHGFDRFFIVQYGQLFTKNFKATQVPWNVTWMCVTCVKWISSCSYDFQTLLWILTTCWLVFSLFRKPPISDSLARFLSAQGVKFRPIRIVVRRKEGNREFLSFLKTLLSTEFCYPNSFPLSRLIGSSRAQLLTICWHSPQPYKKQDWWPSFLQSNSSGLVDKSGYYALSYH